MYYILYNPLSSNGKSAKYVLKVAKKLEKRNEKYYVNLKAVNYLDLQRAGVMDISVSDCCTMCQNHRFWSHRVVGNQRGSQGAIIVCKE